MSGTIPSMETASDELKDNTIVIGALSLSNPARISPDFYKNQSSEPPVTLLKRRCVECTLRLLDCSPFQRERGRAEITGG